MLDSLIIVVLMLLSMGVYYKIDEEYAITDKVSSKIKVDKKWQPFLVVCCSDTFLIIIGSACI